MEDSITEIAVKTSRGRTLRLAPRDHRLAVSLYVVLGSIFIACLVAGNLIFQKFFTWSPFTWLQMGAGEGSLWYAFSQYTFELSVGIIPYPLTFLVTDIISEVYGRRRANLVVLAGLFAAGFVFIIVLLSDFAQATAYSPVDNATFTRVFGLTGAAVTASMTAYLAAQFIDIRIFHFWKRMTDGKHLWLRNNFSTVASQLIDTALVLALLCFFGVLPWSLFGGLLLNGFLFKAMVALLDTPLLYLAVYLIRKRFSLNVGEEMYLP